MLALGHVAEGVLHVSLGEHGALERLHHAIADACPQQLCHLLPAGVRVLPQRIQQDAVEGDVFQKDGHAWGDTQFMATAPPRAHHPEPTTHSPTGAAGLTQRVVVRKVEFADLQEAAVLSQAAHAGL